MVAETLTEVIAALQFARTQVIDVGVRAKQIETNLDVALALLQELAARRAT